MITRRPSGRVPFSGGAASALPRPVSRALGPFGSLVTAIDPSLLGPGQSPSQQNCEVEDGAIGWARGYRSVIGPVTDCTGTRMFSYFSTYTSAGVFKDGFLAVLVVSGQQKLYEISLDPSSDVWEYHEILFSAASFALPATYTRCVAFRDTVYIFNRDSSETGQDPGPLLTYTPGSYVATVVKRPAAPTSSIGVNYAKNSSGGTAYSILRYTGGDPVSPADTNEVTYDGTVASSTGTALTGENFEVEHLDVKGLAFVQFILNGFTAGDQNFENNDVFTFALIVKTPGSFQIDPQSVQFYLGNSVAGSASVELSVTKVPVYNADGDLVRVDCRAEFTNKTRSSWTTTRYVKVAYSVTRTSSTVGNNHLFISPVTIGGIANWFEADADVRGLKAGHTWYNPTSGYESDIGGEVELNPVRLLGDKWAPSGSVTTAYMGTVPVLTLSTSAESGVTKSRVYVARQVRTTSREKEYDKWRRPADGEQDDTDTSYVLHTTFDEYEGLSEYTPAPFRHDDIDCSCVCGQYVAWGYHGGEQNIRLSRVGEALLQADPDDVLVSTGNTDDLARGATFSLTDDHTDTPRGMVLVGSVLIILGNDGLSAMIDTGQGPTKGVPSSMSPPRRVKGAPGVIGPDAFFAGKNRAGHQGVYYLTKDGESVKFVAVFENFDGKSGFVIEDVSDDLSQESMHELLYGGSRLKNPEVAMLFVDPVDDALWTFYNNRRLKLSGAAKIDGLRKWSYRDYEEGQHGSNWDKMVQAGQRGIFAIRANGTVDEFERANIKQSGTADRAIVPIDAAPFTGTADLSTDRVTYTSPPGWTNGWGVTNLLTVAGFTANTTVYARRISGFVYEFYDTAAHARDTGSTTGRLDLTASVSVTLRPIGQDDGSVPPTCYWDSPKPTGNRRRAFRARIERETLTDLVTVKATADRANQTVTVASGEKHVRFGHTVSGQNTQYRITLPVLADKVTQCVIEELVLDGAKQR